MQAINLHTSLSEQVIKTLLYFDIFNYPLKAREVFQFLQANAPAETAVVDCLNTLAEKKYVFRFGDFYSLHADKKNISRRINGNAEAGKFLHVARHQARLIGGFPYVRAVMASGSFSKGYMDKESDLDFFIVTEPGRLWIARTLLVMYKRIFLLNSHKHFCVNYFVDSSHLEIEEKNLFTATELATLIPLYNIHGYKALQSSNRWVQDFFPNFRMRGGSESGKRPGNFMGKIIEWLLFPMAPWLDKFFMRITLTRWHKIYGDQYAKKDFDIAFKSKRHVSKNHPRYFQKKILEMYHLKLAEYKNRLTGIARYE